jgi:hypothetical protein
MWVSDYLENVDLPGHSLYVINICDFIFLEDFNGHLY